MVVKGCCCCLVVVVATPLVFTWLLLHAKGIWLPGKLGLWKPNPGKFYP